jgi:hypothetical protein
MNDCDYNYDESVGLGHSLDKLRFLIHGDNNLLYKLNIFNMMIIYII